MEAKLVVVGGKANMGEVKLRLPMTIGRGRKADLIISHPTVSRIHCELTEADGALVIRDNDSSNGTFLDDEQVKQSVVRPGQILKIGPLSFRAEYEPSASKPKSKPATVTELAATQTMTYEELMGDDASSVVTSPPTKPGAKPKPAAKAEPKKAEVAKGKPAAEPPKKQPAAPAPVAKQDIGATDDDFDFSKDIEFVDDASPAEQTAPTAVTPTSLPTDDDADFDFLSNLEEPKATPPAPAQAKAEPPAKVEPKPQPEPKAKSTPAPVPAPKVEEEPEFDFLADLGPSDSSSGSSSAQTIDESALVEPHDETYRKHTPTETVDFDFLGGFKKSNADSLAPEPEAPQAEEAPAFEEEPVVQAAAETVAEPNVEEPKAEAEFDFLEELDVAAEKPAEAVEKFEVEEPEPTADEVAFEPPVEEAAPELPAVAEAAMPKSDDDVGFDFLAELEPEPTAPTTEEAAAVEPPQAVAPPEPEAIAPAKSADDEAFFDFLADEPAATTEEKVSEAPSLEPEPVAEAETPAVEEPVKSEGDAWSFDVETEPAADVTSSFVGLTPSESEPAAVDDFLPPEAKTESQAAEPTTEEAAFDFLADEAPATPEAPAAEADAFPQFDVAAKSDSPDATIDFRGGEIDEPAAPAPAFSFAPPQVDEPSPFVEEPSAEESIETAPSFAAAAAPIARAPVAKKPSFFDKLKMLFSAASKKKPQPAKAKSTPSVKPSEGIAPKEREPVLPFAAASIAPPSEASIQLSDAPIRLSDDPIPFDDEPMNVSDELVAPTAETESKPAADDFAFDEFLSDTPAVVDAPSAEAFAPSPTIDDEIAFTDEPAFDVAAPETPTAEGFPIADWNETAPAVESKAEAEAFDFLADEPGESVAEAPQSEPAADDKPAFDVMFDAAPSFEVAPPFEAAPPATPVDEPTIAAPQAWSTGDAIPLADDLIATDPIIEPMPLSPTAETAAEPDAATPSTPAEAEFDFASFLDEPTPAAASSSVEALVEPPIEAAAVEAAATDELFAADEPAATADADLADEIFGFDVEPAPGAAADLPAPESTMPEPAWSDAPAPAEASLDADLPQGVGTAADPDMETYLFAPETAEPELAPMSAEAEPMPTPVVATPATVRVRSIDVDAPLGASHRIFARAAVRGPRIDVPHMEPDVPAGRTFNRTGRRPAAVEAATADVAPAETVESPFVAAAATTAFGDMTSDLPPVSADADFGDTPSDDFHFADEGQVDAAIAESPTPAAPADESLPDDLFSDEVDAVADVAELPPTPAPADESSDDAFDFFADEEPAVAEAPPQADDAIAADEFAAKETTDADDAFAFLADEPQAADVDLTTADAPSPTEPKAKKSAPPAKQNDQDLDDFFNDLGMG